MNEEELQWLKDISTTTGISYSGDMTITTDFANKLIDYIKELEQLQNNWNELNKQLENKYEKVGTLTNEVLYEENTKLINQQKKFIEYLENEININPYDISDYDYEDIINTILSKYKEITGDDIDENYDKSANER